MDMLVCCVALAARVEIRSQRAFELFKACSLEMMASGAAAAGEHLSAHHTLLLQKGYLPGQALLCNP